MSFFAGFPLEYITFACRMNVMHIQISHIWKWAFCVGMFFMFQLAVIS